MRSTRLASCRVSTRPFGGRISRPLLRRWPADVVTDPEVKRRVVGLPDLVGLAGLAAVEQLEGVLIHLGPFVSEGHQGRVDLLDDSIHAAVAGDGPALLLSKHRDLTVD